ncbi:MAG: DUF120 domain-containing protein [Candidatus Methanomethylicia archaeon]
MKGRLVILLYQLAVMGALRGPINIKTSVLKDYLGVSQQSVSRWILELEKLGLIVRDLSGRKQTVKISDKGLSVLRGFYINLSRVFEEFPKKFKIRGFLFSGLGEGAFYTSIPHYKKQFQEKLGFEPYPGTLNLRLKSVADIEVKRVLKGLPGIVISGFSNGLRSYGGAKCFKAKIDGIDCVLVLVERTHYGDDVIEILSPIKIRDALGLKDGSEVEVEVYVNY